MQDDEDSNNACELVKKLTDNTRLNADRRDLLDDISRRADINKTLVKPHLEPIPSIGTFAARRLTRSDPEDFRGHADGSLELQVLLIRAMNKIRANLFQALHIGAGQRDTNLLLLRTRGLERLLYGSHVVE